MVPYRKLRERVRCYAAFGGTPRYLACLDPGRPVVDNVADLLLRPGGEVRLLVETALDQERGLKVVPKHKAILRAIGTGTSELAAIRSRAGLQVDADTAVRRMVERLVELGYVQTERNIGAPVTAPFRCRIEDPAFASYFEFVTRFEATLVRHAPLHVWEQHVAPVFDAYVGHVFERVCEQAHRRLAEHLGLPMVQQWGRWEGQDRERASLELDIVAPLTDRRVMNGGVKWNAEPLPARWHHHHVQMLERLTRSGVRWAHAAAARESPLLWVAAGGFTEEFERAARAARDEVYLWNLDTLYAPAPRARKRRGVRRRRAPTGE